MNQFIEKIKSLDKKVLIGIGIAIALVVILLVLSLISGIKSPAGNDKIQNGSEIGGDYGIETENSTEAVNGTESLGTEMTTESEIGTETGTESAESGAVNGQLPSDTTNSSGEEILGSGNASTPYMEILGKDCTITTVEIGADQSVYYDIYRVGGMYLTINDSDAYVVYNNRKYEAKNGKVSLKVDNALASQAVRFEIGNKGTTSKSFEVKFAYPTGSRSNPTIINSLNSINTSLAAGNDIGHYYKYTAEQNGKIRFYVSGSNKCGLTVMNNRNSATRSFGADAKVDEQGKEYIELDVNAGDVIMIQVYAYPDSSWKYPATEVTWFGQYQ